MQLDGSPPHTWGRRIPPGFPYRWFRFTPTHVGKTWDDNLKLFAGTVHPHTRGEDIERPLEYQ